jgi:hypothetical protein
MPNLKSFIEASTNVIQSLTDDAKPPLHVGEVMSCWMYLAFVEEIIVYEEVAINTTIDEELKNVFIDAKKVAESHKMEMSDFMKNEGVPLPPSPQDKPHSLAGAIPLGAKFTDSELINALSINLATVTVMCAQSASQTIRNDLGLMFIKFQMDKMFLGVKAKKIMAKKGWLKIPPSYFPPGAPTQK